MSHPVPRVGFCVSGFGRLARSAIIHFNTLGIEPILLVAEAKAAPDLRSFCVSRGVQFSGINYDNRQQADHALSDICKAANLDLLCLTYDKVIPRDLVAHYPGRIINVHLGLLPAFKGMRAIRQAVDADVRFVGATIHEVDEEVDHGAIIAQCVHGVHEDDSEEAIGRRLFDSIRLMYLQVIAWYAEGRVHKDARGRLRVRTARYGELPISPAVERSFAEPW